MSEGVNAQEIRFYVSTLPGYFSPSLPSLAISVTSSLL
jgi:hypothetical protein